MLIYGVSANGLNDANNKSLSSILIGSWPLSLRAQTDEADMICHGTQTLAYSFAYLPTQV